MRNWAMVNRQRFQAQAQRGGEIKRVDGPLVKRKRIQCSQHQGVHNLGDFPAVQPQNQSSTVTRSPSVRDDTGNLVGLSNQDLGGQRLQLCPPAGVDR